MNKKNISTLLRMLIIALILLAAALNTQIASAADENQQPALPNNVVMQKNVPYTLLYTTQFTREKYVFTFDGTFVSVTKLMPAPGGIFAPAWSGHGLTNCSLNWSPFGPLLSKAAGVPHTTACWSHPAGMQVDVQNGVATLRWNNAFRWVTN